MRMRYVLVDVFTEQKLQGNQLAVFVEVDAARVTAATMQAVAGELALSETTFVVGSGERGPRVRIFTPEVELGFAGHPTLGTAAVLAPAGGGRVTLELGVGAIPVPVPVDVQATAYGWRAELTAPPARRVALASAGAQLAAAVGLEAAALDERLPVEAWSCGNVFALLPVKDRAAVARATAASRGPEPGDPLGIVVFAVEAVADAGRDGAVAVHARVFIQGSRVPEDPATGSANAPLCAYLHEHGRIRLGQTLTTTQGVEMGRPSRLWARLERDEDGELRPRVAGGVVRVGEGALEI
jgi:trans-2,3-dihydro-3-hydroxyanthranilate isomerase